MNKLNTLVTILLVSTLVFAGNHKSSGNSAQSVSEAGRILSLPPRRIPHFNTGYGPTSVSYRLKQAQLKPSASAINKSFSARIGKAQQKLEKLKAELETLPETDVDPAIREAKVHELKTLIGLKDLLIGKLSLKNKLDLCTVLEEDETFKLQDKSFQCLPGSIAAWKKQLKAAGQQQTKLRVQLVDYFGVRKAYFEELHVACLKSDSLIVEKTTEKVTSTYTCSSVHKKYRQNKFYYDSGVLNQEIEQSRAQLEACKKEGFYLAAATAESSEETPNRVECGEQVAQDLTSALREKLQKQEYLAASFRVHSLAIRLVELRKELSLSRNYGNERSRNAVMNQFKLNKLNKKLLSVFNRYIIAQKQVLSKKSPAALAKKSPTSNARSLRKRRVFRVTRLARLEKAQKISKLLNTYLETLEEIEKYRDPNYRGDPDSSIGQSNMDLRSEENRKATHELYDEVDSYMKLQGLMLNHYNYAFRQCVMHGYETVHIIDRKETCSQATFKYSNYKDSREVFFVVKLFLLAAIRANAEVLAKQEKLFAEIQILSDRKFNVEQALNLLKKSKGSEFGISRKESLLARISSNISEAFKKLSKLPTRYKSANKKIRRVVYRRNFIVYSRPRKVLYSRPRTVVYSPSRSAVLRNSVAGRQKAF